MLHPPPFRPLRACGCFHFRRRPPPMLRSASVGRRSQRPNDHGARERSRRYDVGLAINVPSVSGGRGQTYPPAATLKTGRAGIRKSGSKTVRWADLAGPHPPRRRWCNTAIEKQVQSICLAFFGCWDSFTGALLNAIERPFVTALNTPYDTRAGLRSLWLWMLHIDCQLMNWCCPRVGHLAASPTCCHR